MNEGDLKRRTRQFGLRVIRVVEADELTAILVASRKTRKSKIGNQQARIE